MRSAVRLRLVDAGFALGWRVGRALPRPVVEAAFRCGADLAYWRGGAGVERLRANLSRVVPAASPGELQALVRAGVRSYARYWSELFRLSAIDPDDVRRRTHVLHEERFLDAVAAGRGVVVAVPHSGNWDAAGMWCVSTLRGMGRDAVFTTVAERLQPESLFQRFTEYRRTLGFEVIPADGGAYRALLHRLRRGGVVSLVADRDLGGSGIDVALFGEPARLPAGPARLAALTGAVLLPAFPHFTPSGWGVRFAAPISVPDGAAVAKATQDLADALASLIVHAPADWHMMQPVWRSDR